MLSSLGRFQSSLALLVLVGFVLLSGCWGCSQRNMYSGKFCVSSDYQPIKVHDWKRFDSWSPGRGKVGLGGETLTFFPWREDFPDSTIVVWSEDGSDEMKEQEIDLRGVVPKGVEGTTHFELGADGVWTVEFIPGAAY